MSGGALDVSPLPCPFCGGSPEVEPFSWKQSGAAWGRVACRNPKCAIEPSVEAYGEDIEAESGDESSARCKSDAIAKWNRRQL